MTDGKETIGRSTAVMSLATLFSRVTGLMRTVVMANAVGATLVASAYQVANTVPNMIYELVVGGLLTAAFIPIYMEQLEKGGLAGGSRYATNLLNVVVVAMGLLTIIATIFAPQIILSQTFTQSIDVEIYRVAVDFFRIFAVQLLFYGIGGVVSSLLNANRVYFFPAIAPAVNNVVVIASFGAYMVVLPSNADAANIVLAIGTSLGVAMQLAVQLPSLARQGIKWELRISLKEPGFIETLKTSVPMIIYLAGSTIAFSFRNAYSLESGDSGPAILAYAWTWFQLPHGIIAVSFAKALFTEMAKATAKNNLSAFKNFLQQGLSGTLLIMIPLAGLMAALSKPLMQFFEIGSFQGADVLLASSVLSVWIIALPFYSLQLYLFSVFASIRRLTVYASICTGFCIVRCLLYALLGAEESLGLIGVCVADIAYYVISTLVLLLALRRIVGAMGGRLVVASAGKALLAAVAGVVFVIIASMLIPVPSGPLWGFLDVLVCGGCALAIVFCVYRLMRVREVLLVIKAAKRLLGISSGRPSSP